MSNYKYLRQREIQARIAKLKESKAAAERDKERRLNTVIKPHMDKIMLADCLVMIIGSAQPAEDCLLEDQAAPKFLSELEAEGLSTVVLNFDSAFVDEVRELSEQLTVIYCRQSLINDQTKADPAGSENLLYLQSLCNDFLQDKSKSVVLISRTSIRPTEIGGILEGVQCKDNVTLVTGYFTNFPVIIQKGSDSFLIEKISAIYDEICRQVPDELDKRSSNESLAQISQKVFKLRAEGTLPSEWLVKPTMNDVTAEDVLANSTLDLLQKPGYTS